MSLALTGLDDDAAPEPRRLNATELLAARHARRSAVRALAGLATDADDFRLLADMLDLDPADARAELPQLQLTPALAAPVVVNDKPDTRPAGLRFVATPAQQQPPRVTRTPRRPSLQAELEQLEHDDPTVAAASRSYDQTVDRVLAKPATRTPTKKGAATDPVTAQGEVSRAAAAHTAHDGATGHDGGPVTDEAAPAAEEGHRGARPAPVAPASSSTCSYAGCTAAANACADGWEFCTAHGGHHDHDRLGAPSEPAGYRAPGRVVTVPNDQKPRCKKAEHCVSHAGHAGRHKIRPPQPPTTLGVVEPKNPSADDTPPPAAGRLSTEVLRARAVDVHERLDQLLRDLAALEMDMHTAHQESEA